ncbi:hypothetical protein BJY00DRAFT_318265 [Aspergillus carlsbadensis]|nr:hypothetical protein BJY00DRAFT_318265 [Aspergillus carlsbadensis]
MSMNTSISDTIPLYLADNLSLDEAVQRVTTHPTTKKALLAAVLSEAKSLPREVDTHPTSPTPDRPSPAQERLLGFVRAVVEHTDTGSVGGGGGASVNVSGTGGSGGYGIELDAGEGSFGPCGWGGIERNGEGNGGAGGEGGEGYELVKDIIRASFPSFPPPPPTTTTTTMKGGRDTTAHEQHQPHETLSTSPFEPPDPYTSTSTSTSPTASTSTTNTAPKPSLSISTTHHRRSSSTSGPTKHFNNLISFLAFLTKENLLLSRGVGERIAVEMVRDTLSHHGGSIHGHGQGYTHSSAKRGFSSGSGSGSGGGAGSAPWFGDAGSESITAAALWMIIMGEELFARVQEQGKQKGVQRSRAETASGTAGTGKGGGRGGLVDEWETWMARLQYLSLREDLSVEAREAAAEGAAVMRRV